MHILHTTGKAILKITYFFVLLVYPHLHTHKHAD